MDRPDGDLDQRCAETVERLLARHGWRLLDQAEFVSRTRLALASQAGIEVHFAAFGVYNLALYRACSGVEGDDRRELAYGELFRVLYERAWHAYPTICEDATQQALAQIISRFEACREPRAFIPFALQHLMGAARELRRRARPAHSLEREVGEEGIPLGDRLPSADDIEAGAIAREQREHLHSFLARYVRDHPRAQKQIDAVRLKFLAGLDDEHISRALGVSVQNVHVLRSRGLRRLRDEPGWHDSWEQG
ncbi:MAG: sigma-70 family RNA polymerase sigma factor [Chloroflexales bacterium]|nr:sigma-70 family RNA polymerase sigma factor [Chloroflexales bacterium]